MVREGRYAEESAGDARISTSAIFHRWATSLPREMARSGRVESKRTLSTMSIIFMLLIRLKSQIVLLVLVKSFVFEMRDGPDTKVEKAWGLLPRPKIAGEMSTGVPLRVRRFEG